MAYEMTVEEYQELAHRIMTSRKLKDDSDFENVQLFAYSTIPALCFMGMEFLAHGIFPSHVGAELANVLIEIIHTIRREFAKR